MANNNGSVRANSRAIIERILYLYRIEVISETEKNQLLEELKKCLNGKQNKYKDTLSLYVERRNNVIFTELLVLATEGRKHG